VKAHTTTTAWLYCSKVEQAAFSCEGEVVPVKYMNTWKERTFVVISRSRYQPVGQRVMMPRGSYKWDQKVTNGDGNSIVNDVIHKREFIVYSPLVEPTPI